MLKPNYINICFYLFIKSIIFYLLLMVVNNDFTMLKSVLDTKKWQDFFFNIWIILFFPLIDIVLFSIPLYLSFNIKKEVYFILSIFIILFLEYLIYIYFTSQKIMDIDAFFKVVISLILLVGIFYRTIKNKITFVRIG